MGQEERKVYYVRDGDDWRMEVGMCPFKFAFEQEWQEMMSWNQITRALNMAL